MYSLFDTTESEEQPQPIDTSNGQTIDAPLSTSYYHLEYSLLPGEEPMKTDVVFYGVACKVYMEKHEARVVKTWQEDDVTWIAWAYRLGPCCLVKVWV